MVADIILGFLTCVAVGIIIGITAGIAAMLVLKHRMKGVEFIDPDEFASEDES